MMRNWVPVSNVVSLFMMAPVLQAQVLLDTAFTFQGKLDHYDFQGAAQIVTSACDFRFSLCETESGTCSLGISESLAVPVTGGLFTVSLDFGANVFDGSDRWLDIEVMCPLPPIGDSTYATLAPRQRVTAAPYALQTRGIFVDHLGRVGLGTTSPSERLTVASGRIYPAGIGPESGIVFSHLALYEDVDATLKLTSAGGYNFAFLNAGSVGIGTPLPENKLDVRGTVAIETELRTHDASNRNSYAFMNWDGTNNRARIGGYHVVNGLQALYAEPGNTTFVGGNVGIGTGTPGALLEIRGGDNQLLFGHTSATRKAGVVFNQAAGDPSQGGLTFQRRNTAGGFEANLVTLDLASGNLGIGVTNPRVPLHIEGGSHITGGDVGGHLQIGPTANNHMTLDHNDIQRWEGNAPAELILQRYGGDVGIGVDIPTTRFQVNGNACKTVGGSTWLTCSDANIKKDVAPIRDALDTIQRLSPRQFRYTDEFRAKHPAASNALDFGVVAQEYREVFPNFVQEGKDGILYVNTSPLASYSVAAIQELYQLVREQEKRIAEQHEQIVQLVHTLHQLEGGDRRSAPISSSYAAIEETRQGPQRDKAEGSQTARQANEVESLWIRSEYSLYLESVR